MFSSPLGEFVPQARSLIPALGALTVLVGATMCFAQHHLQRMIAFAVISHAGLLIGPGLLTPAGVGGAAIYMLADGLVKASLFMCIGILQRRLAGVDEMHLRGGGQALPGTAALFVVGGLALVGLPPFGTFAGKALIEEEAKALGLYWGHSAVRRLFGDDRSRGPARCGADLCRLDHRSRTKTWLPRKRAKRRNRRPSPAATGFLGSCSSRPSPCSRPGLAWAFPLGY